MKKQIKIIGIFSILFLMSCYSPIPTQARETIQTQSNLLSNNQGLPLRIALMFNSEIPTDHFLNNDLRIVQDIFRIWKIAPLDIIDLSSGVDAKNLAETYSAIILPSIELIDPDADYLLPSETRDAITSAIVDYSLNVIAGGVTPIWDYANKIYEVAFNMTSDGSQFIMGERYEELYKYENGVFKWSIARSGNNVVLHNSLLSDWWGLCGYNEGVENEVSDEDFVGSDFFNILGLLLPESIAWIFGVPAFTLRNDDIYVRAWRFEEDLEALKQYVAFLRQEAGLIEASNGVVGLYDQETNFEADSYQRALGNYGRLVSHSWTHPFLSTLPLEQQKEELTKTQDYLSNMYPEQYDPSLFIVPNNDWNELTIVALNQTGTPIFTAANYPVPIEYMKSPAKKHIFLLYDHYSVPYEGQNYTSYGFPWMYAYDADTNQGSQGITDLARSPEGWVTEDYTGEGFSPTKNALSEFYYPLMMGTHGVLQAWEYFPEWAAITSNQIIGLHNEFPYLRIADNGAALNDLMNLEDHLTLESATYSESEITLTLNNNGPTLKNAVLFANSFTSHQIDQIFIGDSVYLGFGDQYIFIPAFTGTSQIRISFISSGTQPQQIPIMRGVTVGGVIKTSSTNRELSIQIKGFDSELMPETTILSIDFSRMETPSKIAFQQIYVQGEEGNRGIYQVEDLKQGSEGWLYDDQIGLLKIKARVFGVEQIHILLVEGASANHHPTATINSPEDGAAIARVSTIVFEGTGVDEDGDDLIYIWLSSLDGEIGTGQILELEGATLSPGVHTITLIVAENGPNYAFAGRSRIKIDVSPRIVLSQGTLTLLQLAALFSGVLILAPIFVRRKIEELKESEEKEKEKKSSLIELLYYTLLSNGPWLVATAVFLILGMGFMAMMGYPEKRFFAFALGIAIPLTLIVAGWLVALSATSIADYYATHRIFSCRHFMKRFLLITVTTIIIIAFAMLSIMSSFGVEIGTALLAFIFFVTFTPLWYAIGVLNAFKQYGRMTIFFIGGIGAGYALSMWFTSTGQSLLRISIAYGIGYLIAAIGSFIFIFTSLLRTPRFQQMDEGEYRHMLALLSNPTRSDAIETIEKKTSIRSPLTQEKITLLEDGLKLKLKEKEAISLRSALKSNSWLIIGALSYATFVWIDRIFVWVATGQQTSGFVLAINSNYEIGLNIGLWVLVFTTGIIAYTFKDFSDKYSEATNRLYSETLDEIESGITGLGRNVFNQLIKIVAVAAVIALIIFVNGPQLLKLFNVGTTVTDLGIESMTPTSPENVTNPSGGYTSPSLFVLRMATIDAIFIAIFLYTQLGLSYLARHKKAATVLLVTVGVSFPLVAIIIILGFPSYYAVLGHLVGSVVAAGVGVVLLQKELQPDTIIHRYLSHQL